jgi:hypothetical protein
MLRNTAIAAFLILFGAVIYLGAVVTEQQRAIEALVSDNATSLNLQVKFSNELSALRAQIEQNKTRFVVSPQ